MGAVGSSPNHAFGRPLKVGKDISAGMCVAVEALVQRRDIAAEHAEWRRWWAAISAHITQIPGVTTRGERRRRRRRHRQHAAAHPSTSHLAWATLAACLFAACVRARVC